MSDETLPTMSAIEDLVDKLTSAQAESIRGVEIADGWHQRLRARDTAYDALMAAVRKLHTAATTPPAPTPRNAPFAVPPSTPEEPT